MNMKNDELTNQCLRHLENNQLRHNIPVVLSFEKKIG